MRVRRALPFLVAALGMALLAMPRVAVAQQPADLTCVGAGSGRIDPGITLQTTPQHITVELKAGSLVSPATPCTSLTGVPYAGATFLLDGTGNLGCLSGRVTGTAVVTWDTGEVSTGTWSLNLPIFLLSIFQFRIIDGPLEGAQALLLGAPTGLAGNCITHPLTRLGGVGLGLLLHA